MPKAYSYIRFSTPEQLKGDSLRRQLDKSDAYIKEHGLELDTSIRLRDLGVSAFTKKNIEKGALGQFLTLVEEGKIPRGSYLLVESLDRLSRATVVEALRVFLNIIKAGITIVTLIDKIEYSQASVDANWTSLIGSIAIMARANEESTTKSSRQRDKLDEKRRLTRDEGKPFTMRCPQWLTPKEDRSGFVPIDKRVALVKEIFKLAQDGIGSFKITRLLNEKGREPFGPSKLWSQSSIEKILNSPSVYGEFQPQLQRDGTRTNDGEPIQNYYPAIITREQYLKVQDARKSRRRGGGHNKGDTISNLFSGYVKCGYCGGSMRMNGYVGKRKDSKSIRKSKYLVCSNAQRKSSECYFMQWNYNELEQRILKFVREVDLDELLNPKAGRASAIETAEGRVLVIGAEIAEIDEKLTKLMESFFSKKGTLPEKIVEVGNELEGQKRALQEQLKAEQSELSRLRSEIMEADTQRSSIIQLFEAMDTLEGEELYRLRAKLSERLLRVFERIALYPGGDCMTKQEMLEYQKVVEFMNTIDFTKAEEKKYKKMLAKKFPNQNMPDKNNRMIYMKLRSGVRRVVDESGVKAIEMRDPVDGESFDLPEVLKVVHPMAV